MPHIESHVSQSKPSTNRKHLVQFCMEVYFPSWFEIKRKHTTVDGAKNFFNIVNRVTKLPNPQIRTVALNVLQRNAYFAHPENVLLEMVGDNEENLRRSAVANV